MRTYLQVDACTLLWLPCIAFTMLCTCMWRSMSDPMTGVCPGVMLLSGQVIIPYNASLLEFLCLFQEDMLLFLRRKHMFMKQAKVITQAGVTWDDYLNRKPQKER